MALCRHRALQLCEIVAHLARYSRPVRLLGGHVGERSFRAPGQRQRRFNAPRSCVDGNFELRNRDGNEPGVHRVCLKTFGRESAGLGSLVQPFAESFESRLRRAATRAGDDQLRLRVLELPIVPALTLLCRLDLLKQFVDLFAHCSLQRVGRFRGRGQKFLSFEMVLPGSLQCLGRLPFARDLLFQLDKRGLVMANRIGELRQRQPVLAERVIEAIETRAFRRQVEVSRIDGEIISCTRECVLRLCELCIGFAESRLGLPTSLLSGVVLGVQAQQPIIGWRALVLLSCRFTTRCHLCGGGVAVRDRCIDFGQSRGDLFQPRSSRSLACRVPDVLRCGFSPGAARAASAKLTAWRYPGLCLRRFPLRAGDRFKNRGDRLRMDFRALDRLLERWV